MKPDIILIGGGGHCRACIDVIEAQGIYRIAGIVDLAEKKGRDIFGYPYIGTDDDLPDLVNPHTHFLITLGQIKTPARRIALFEKIKALGGTLPVIQSPLAHVSRHADIQEGTIVMHHALVNAGARVGKNCIINTKALVEHDVVVEDHCHIATGAVVNGGTRIGLGTFVGSNSMAGVAITIGDFCVVGGGGANHARSVFLPDIERPGKVAIFGASGFSRECADIVLKDNIESLVYIDLSPAEPEYFGYPVVPEKQIPQLVEQGYVFVIGVGENRKRKKIFEKYPHLPFPNIIHPSASFGKNQRDMLKHNMGNIITAGVCFTNKIETGNFGIYNLNATIGHDCVIKDFINVAPGANISGNVSLGELSYIGTGAAIIQGRDMKEKILMGRGSMIGAGAVVTKNVGAGMTVVGVPAKPIKKY